MNRKTSLIALLGYLALSFLLYGRGFENGEIFQPGGDPIVYIWCLNWWPFALSHGINPSVSDYIWNPAGFPMWWANSIPSLALILSPITLTLGAVRSWNLINLVTPALNAYACFLLIRYLTKQAMPSFMAALIFGFASYITAQQLGHISLSLVPFVPMAVLLVLKRAARELTRITYIAIMAPMAIVQFGISTEVLASSAFFGLVAFLIFRSRYRDSRDLSGVAKDTAIAGVIAVLVLSPALYYMAIGSKELPSVINSPKMFSADLLNVLIPNPTIWLGGDSLQSLAARFTGNFSEQGAYIGIGILVILILAIRASAQERWSKPLWILLAVTAICSLGPVLWVAGVNTRIPLPWLIFTKVPIIRHALPTRFTLYVSLVIAIYIGIWLSMGAGNRKARYAATLVSLLFLLPNPKWFAFGDVTTPAALSKTEVMQALGANANAVVLPYGYLGNSMLWQLNSGMAFKMAGGYVGFVPQSQWRYKAMMYLYDAEQAPTQDAFNQAVAEFCASNRVTAIVLAPGTSKYLATAISNLPWPKDAHGDTIVVRVPNL